MKSHGKAGECGSLAVYCHHAAGICGAGDGIFGVGGDGAGAVWVSVCIFVEAIDLGRRGLVAMVVGMRVDYRRYKAPAVVFSLLGITTLLLIRFSFWIARTIRIAGFTLAGSRFNRRSLAKPVLILFLAYFLEGRVKTMDDWRNNAAARRRL